MARSVVTMIENRERGEERQLELAKERDFHARRDALDSPTQNDRKPIETRSTSSGKWERLYGDPSGDHWKLKPVGTRRRVIAVKVVK